MKRMFALIGFTGLTMLTFAFYCGEQISIFFIVLGIIGVCGSIFILKSKYLKQTLLIFFSAVIFFSSYSLLYSNLIFNPITDKYAGSEVNLSAVLEEEPHKSFSMYYYELKTEVVNGNNEQLKILLKSPNQLDINPFDVIHCKAPLVKCDNNYYRSKGYHYISTVDYSFDYTTSKSNEFSINTIGVSIRSEMKNALNIMMPDKFSSLSKALLLGDKFTMTETIHDEFAKTGLSFLVVVSGLHMVIIYSFCLLLFKKIFKKQLVHYSLTIFIVVMFMAITGFTFSVVRAGIMIILLLFGKIMYRKSDSLNSLGFAIFCIIMVNPFAVGDIGLLLSFTATLGIIVFQSAVFSKLYSLFPSGKIKHKLIKPIVTAFSVSISATIAITPITMLAFNTITLTTIIFSTLLTPLISVLLVSIFLSVLFYIFNLTSFFAYPFALISCLLEKILLLVLHLSASLPFTQLYISTKDSMYILSALFLLVGISILLKNYKTNIKFASFMLILILLAGFSGNQLASAKRLNLKILSTSGGNTVLLDSSYGTALMCCGGSKAKTDDIVTDISLISNKLSFLALVDTTNEQTGYGSYMLSQFDVSSVLLYDTDSTNEKVYNLATDNKNYMSFSENDSYTVNLWNEIYSEIFNIKGKTWQYITTDKYSILIIPPKANANDIQDKYKCADIIIASQCPKNSNELKTKVFVYTGLPESYDKQLNSISEISQQIVTTNQSTITLDLGKDYFQ